MSRKYKKICTTLNYLEHFVILAPTITGCISISASAFLLRLSIGITSNRIKNLCNNWKNEKVQVNNSENKKRNTTALLGKSKLNNIEILISKALIDSNISHHEFVLINNVLKEYENMKK